MQRTTWLIAFLVAASAILGAVALSVLRDREASLEAARQNLAATARLLEQHAERALEAGDAAVRTVVEVAGDPRTLREESRGVALHQVLARIVSGSAQLASAWVMDADGYTIAENWRHPPLTTGSFATRPYFQAHLNGERALHIGELAIGPNASRLRFTMTRPLLLADGRFAGVAATGVFSEHFAAVYAEAGLGDAAQLALYRADGAPLAIWPAPVTAVPPLRADLPAPGTVGLTPDGHLVATRRLERFPVVLVVSQPVQAVLAPWRQRARLSGGVLAAVLATLGALTAFGLRGAAHERALTRALQAERGTLARRVAERTAALAESEMRLRLATEGARVGIWETDLTTGRGTWSRQAVELFGTDRAVFSEGDWLDAVHPDDRPAVAAAWRRAVEEGAPYEIEMRTAAPAPDGGDRWLLSRGTVQRGVDGRALHARGVLIDVTTRRRGEEKQVLMAREMDHRAKNALSVVQAALRLAPKSDARAYASAIEGRVAALARAHAALAEGRWQGVQLRALAEAELAPFLAPVGDGAFHAGADGVSRVGVDGASRAGAMRRATLDGPDLLLTPVAVQALSMALHELATNATKYGALGTLGGRVALNWCCDEPAGLLRLTWEEQGGPVIAGAPAQRGFGSRVLDATLGHQLGGRVEQLWRPEGLLCRIALPLSRARADAAPAAREPAEAMG